MRYILSESCPEVIIVQSLESGDYDYSEYGCAEAAWEAEQSESWVKEGDIEANHEEFLLSLTTYTREEVLAAANDDYSWPVELGFVIEIEADEDADEDE